MLRLRAVKLSAVVACSFVNFRKLSQSLSLTLGFLYSTCVGVLASGSPQKSYPVRKTWIASKPFGELISMFASKISKKEKIV